MAKGKSGAIKDIMSDDDGLTKEEKKVYKNNSNKWRAEDDVRCLTSANEIKNDKERHAMALHCLKQKAKAMNDAVKSMKKEGDE